MTDKPDSEAMGIAVRLMLWTKSRRFTFTSNALVVASASFALAAFRHGFERELRRAIDEALFPWFPFGSPVHHADRTEVLLWWAAILFAGAALTTGIVAIRRKEPVLRSFFVTVMLLWVVWRLWFWFAEWTEIRLLVLLGIVLPIVGGIGGMAVGFVLAARRAGWSRSAPRHLVLSAVLGALWGIAVPVLAYFTDRTLCVK
jgi:ammonia channel protein AmtB